MSHLTLPRPSNLHTISSTSTSTSSSTSSRITSQSLKSPFTTPPKNKPYLYVALYPRGNTTTSFHSSCNCDTHHWALLISPRTALRCDPGTRYHLSHSTLPCSYEESDIQTSSPASAILIRIAIAKVRSQTAVETVLRVLPIPLSQDSYTCLSFVRDAFVSLHAKKNKRGCLKSYLKERDWKDVEAYARTYCKRKRDMGRLVGVGARFADGAVDEQAHEEDEDELDPNLNAANGYTEAVNEHTETATAAESVNAHVNGQSVNEDPRVNLQDGTGDEATTGSTTQLHTEPDSPGQHEQEGHEAGNPSQTQTQTQSQHQIQNHDDTVTRNNTSTETLSTTPTLSTALPAAAAAASTQAPTPPPPPPPTPPPPPPPTPPQRRRTNQAGVICTYNFWENREIMS